MSDILHTPFEIIMKWCEIFMNNRGRRFAMSIISSETEKNQGCWVVGVFAKIVYTPPKQKKTQLTNPPNHAVCWTQPSNPTNPPPKKKNGGRSNPRNGCVVGKVVPISTTVSSLVSSSTCSRHFWINLPLGGSNCHQCVCVCNGYIYIYDIICCYITHIICCWIL